MQDIRIEFYVILLFVFGSCLMYTRVLQVCYSLEKTLQETPKRDKSLFRRSVDFDSGDTGWSDDPKESSDAENWDIGLNDGQVNYDIDKDEDEEFGETNNYIHKSVDKPGPHFSTEATVFNPTSPASYPRGGTGTAVKIAYRFEPTVFNSFCRSSPGLLAIIPIYSRPDAVLKRNSMRSTLGEVCKAYKCKIFFIIGMSTNEKINQQLAQEYFSKKDILAMPKLDTYRDLNNKAFHMLNWIIKYCQGPEYVIRLIDDVHVNLDLLFPQLFAINTKRYMFGYISSGRKALRSKKSKFYLSEKEWPFVDFPDYVTGTLFAFRTAMAPELRTNALMAPYCWIEDVWFAGTVRLESDIPLIETKIPPYTGKPGSLNPEYINNYLYVHDLKAKDFYTYFIASKMSRDKKANEISPTVEKEANTNKRAAFFLNEEEKTIFDTFLIDGDREKKKHDVLLQNDDNETKKLKMLINLLNEEN